MKRSKALTTPADLRAAAGRAPGGGAMSAEREIKRRGITLRPSGNERIGPCPRFGGTDRFAINTAKQIWNCRGCCGGTTTK
jgi:hypothetical protein